MKLMPILLGLVGVLLGALWAFQRNLIYLPSRGPVPPAGEVIDGARDVTLETSDGLHLGAWFVPPSTSDNGITVLVANGNAGDRSLRAPLALALADQGFAVLLFDYGVTAPTRGIQPRKDSLSISERRTDSLPRRAYRVRGFSTTARASARRL
jgi:uncharacterized protein